MDPVFNAADDCPGDFAPPAVALGCRIAEPSAVDGSTVLDPAPGKHLELRLFNTSGVAPRDAGLDAVDDCPGDFTAPNMAIDRRSQDRAVVDLNLEAILLALPGRPTVGLQVHNLSTGGIGFRSRRPFRMGELFALRMVMTRQAGKLVLCRTRDVCREASGVWHENGAVFLKATPLLWGHAMVPEPWIEMARDEAR